MSNKNQYVESHAWKCNKCGINQAGKSGICGDCKGKGERSSDYRSDSSYHASGSNSGRRVVRKSIRDYDEFLLPKLAGFEQFMELRDQQSQQGMDPNSQQPGSFQVDPDKPDEGHDNDLEAALQEIIELAKKALEMREKGLGDQGNQKKGSDETDQASFKNLAARPKADSPEGQFGVDM